MERVLTLLLVSTFLRCSAADVISDSIAELSSASTSIPTTDGLVPDLLTLPVDQPVSSSTLDGQLKTLGLQNGTNPGGYGSCGLLPDLLGTLVGQPSTSSTVGGLLTTLGLNCPQQSGNSGGTGTIPGGYNPCGTVPQLLAILLGQPASSSTVGGLLKTLGLNCQSGNGGGQNGTMPGTSKGDPSCGLVRNLLAILLGQPPESSLVGGLLKLLGLDCKGIPGPGTGNNGTNPGGNNPCGTIPKLLEIVLGKPVPTSTIGGLLNTLGLNCNPGGNNNGTNPGGIGTCGLLPDLLGVLLGQPRDSSTVGQLLKILGLNCPGSGGGNTNGTIPGINPCGTIPKILALLLGKPVPASTLGSILKLLGLNCPGYPDQGGNCTNCDPCPLIPKIVESLIGYQPDCKLLEHVFLRLGLKCPVKPGDCCCPPVVNPCDSSNVWGDPFCSLYGCNQYYPTIY